NIASSHPSLSVESVIPVIEELLDSKYNGHPTTIEYLARPDGSVSLVFAVQVQNTKTTKRERDAHSGDILSVIDFVSDGTYNVLPITKQYLPEGQEILYDPQDLDSSPLGWHYDDTGDSNNTSGNNVISFKGLISNVTYQNGDLLVFNYSYDDTLPPTAGHNIDAA
ncbi:hypothetical protein H0H92_013980, partial [Tricholoma furcatifolium]